MKEFVRPDVTLYVYGGGRWAIRQCGDACVYDVLLGCVGVVTVLGTYETQESAQMHVERLLRSEP